MQGCRAKGSQSGNNCSFNTQRSKCKGNESDTASGHSRRRCRFVSARAQFSAGWPLYSNVGERNEHLQRRNATTTCTQSTQLDSDAKTAVLPIGRNLAPVCLSGLWFLQQLCSISLALPTLVGSRSGCVCDCTTQVHVPMCPCASVPVCTAPSSVGEPMPAQALMMATQQQQPTLC